MTNDQMEALRWAINVAATAQAGLPVPKDSAKMELAKEALAEVGRMNGRERQRWARKGK